MHTKFITLPITALALIAASAALAQNPRPKPVDASGEMVTTPTMSADDSMGPTKGRIGTAPPASKGPNDNPNVSAKDTVFLKQAAAGGMKEVQMGRQAEKNGQSAPVKDMGRTLVSDHTTLNKEITTLARRKGITLAGSEQLPDMKGSTFDRDFVHMSIEAHNNDIKLFQGEANNGEDPEVKALAQKALPVLRHHMMMAKNAAQSSNMMDSTQSSR